MSEEELEDMGKETKQLKKKKELKDKVTRLSANLIEEETFVKALYHYFE